MFPIFQKNLDNLLTNPLRYVTMNCMQKHTQLFERGFWVCRDLQVVFGVILVDACSSPSCAPSHWALQLPSAFAECWSGKRETPLSTVTDLLLMATASSFGVASCFGFCWLLLRLEFIPSTFPSRGKSGLPSTPTLVNCWTKKHTVAVATVCFFYCAFCRPAVCCRRW